MIQEHAVQDMKSFHADAWGQINRPSLPACYRTNELSTAAVEFVNLSLVGLWCGVMCLAGEGMGYSSCVLAQAGSGAVNRILIAAIQEASGNALDTPREALRENGMAFVGSSPIIRAGLSRKTTRNTPNPPGRGRYEGEFHQILSRHSCSAEYHFQSPWVVSDRL